MADQLTTDLEALRIERAEPHRRRGAGRLGRVIAWAAVLGGLASAGAYAWPRVEARIFKTEVRVGEVLSVSPAQAQTSVTATGYVVALRLSRVRPRVPGRVARVPVAEGATVREGATLLELDAAEQRGLVAAAQARAFAAQARVAVARANLAEVRVQLERQRRLVGAGAAAPSAVEDLEARVAPLQAAIEAATAEVRAAQAEVASVRIAMTQLTLRAPFDGVVINRPPQVGEVVAPELAPIEVLDPSSLVVEVDVPEGRLSLVRPGGACEVSLDAFPERRFRATVAELGRRVDRARATVPVRVRFAEAVPGALPEMSARVSFLAGEVSDEALRAGPRTLVPAEAVVSRGGATAVFVVEDGVARRTPVRVGPRAGENFELVEGPPPGARVVLRPPAALADGSPVKETSR